VLAAKAMKLFPTMPEDDVSPAAKYEAKELFHEVTEPN